MRIQKRYQIDLMSESQQHSSVLVLVYPSFVALWPFVPEKLGFELLAMILCASDRPWTTFQNGPRQKLELVARRFWAAAWPADQDRLSSTPADCLPDKDMSWIRSKTCFPVCLALSLAAVLSNDVRTVQQVLGAPTTSG